MSTEFEPEQILNLLKIEFFERSSRLAFCCPWHDDNDPSAGFYIDTRLAYCFSCDYTLDPIQFYARYNGLRRSEALRNLESIFGITYAKKDRYNPRLLQIVRSRAENKLKANHPSGMREHSYLGETLDRILLAYERGQIDEEKLDNALKIWYNRVREGTSHAEADQSRVSEDGVDVGFEESLGDLSGSGHQGSQRTMGHPQSDDSVDLA